MGAVIDTDHLADADPDTWGENYRHRSFFGGIGTCDTIRFRLYDDDDVLYYSGRIDRYGLDNETAEHEEDAYRLLKWAESDSGCTSIGLDARTVNGAPCELRTDPDGTTWVHPY